MDSELDFTGASIEECRNADDNLPSDAPSRRYQPPQAPSIQLPNQDAEYVNHIALDIGGSLIKLVYFSPDPLETASSGDAFTPSGSPSCGVGPLCQGSRSPQPGSNHSSPASSQRGGRLHFVKFETSRVEDCINFIEAKGLHRYCGRNGTQEMRVKATGGGAYKYADVFKERLGVVLEKEDEMGCLVAGCNFLLKAIHHEAFMYEACNTTFVPTNEDSDLYPYLLVNIGSGVSMVKVSGENQFERVSGSSIGGGTFWGLCRLLTERTNFDEMLELSMQGDNASVDMLVGDIYGGRDYASIGLSATTIASSFGKVVSQDKSLSDYAPADMCLALCRMVAYNIGQLAHINALRHGIKRIFFGGFFIRCHPYTMETISYAIRFWSKGEMAAMFLRHEGFLGAVGAFLKVHPMVRGGPGGGPDEQARKVRARFVERFSMGAPLTGGAVVGPAIRDVSEKVSWVEKFVAAASSSSSSATSTAGSSGPPSTTGLASTAAAAAEPPAAAAAAATAAAAAPSEGGEGGAAAPVAGEAETEGEAAAAVAARGDHPSGLVVVPRTFSLSYQQAPSPVHYVAARQRMSLHVGVLHFSPTLEPFPLLADMATYEPNTLDINSDVEELRWWVGVLRQQIPVVVEKAAASEGGGDLPQRRAQAFGRAFGAHLDRLEAEPGSYGALGLAELFAMREECLREFGFGDVYRLDKERENRTALAVLSDLLRDLDAEPQRPRLLSLVEGVLAANIFDWGSRACVALYHDGTILDIYRAARLRLSKRPWALDNFDAFADRLLARDGEGGGEGAEEAEEEAEGAEEAEEEAEPRRDGTPTATTSTPAPTHGRCLRPDSSPPRRRTPPYRRVMMFVDNSGADVVLGMLPFARELLRLGCEVVLVANSLPAINDVTAPELRSLLSEAAAVCPIIKAAREAAVKVELATGGHVAPYPGLLPARRSSQNLQLLQQQQPQQEQQQQPRQPEGESPPALAALDPGAATTTTTTTTTAATTAAARSSGDGSVATAAPADTAPVPASISSSAAASHLPPQSGPPPESKGALPSAAPGYGPAPSWHSVATDPRVNQPGPKLYVVSNGQGSPCLDLRRVPDRLAEACVGVDLLVIEGMGRAIHTNFNARFTCDVLKLAMIKTERLAKKLFNGGLYDCVCAFDRAGQLTAQGGDAGEGSESAAGAGPVSELGF